MTGQHDPAQAQQSAPAAVRIPRHDLEAELSVLTTALMGEPDKTARALAAIPDPEAFYAPAHRRLWEAVQALAETGQPVDAVTVASWLRARERLAEIGGLAYVRQVVDGAASVENVEAYAQIVTDTAKQRAIVAYCQRVAAEGYSDVGPVTSWASDVEAGLFDLATAGAASRRSMATVGESAIEVYQRMERGESSGVRIGSGIATLDARLAMHAGDLIVVAARPGMGKSAIVGGIAAHVGDSGGETEQHAALVFSAEMDREQVAQRVLSGRTKIPLAKIRVGPLSDQDWSALTQSTSVLADTAMWIDDKAAPTLGHVRSGIRSVKRALARDARWTRAQVPVRLRLVVVDYLQIMGARRERGRNREAEISELSRGLKQIAREEQVVLIALSQLNRGVEQRPNKRPLLSDLRESGAIEQDADSIVFVYRDEYYHHDSRAKGRAELIVAKQRNGPEGRAIVGFDGAFTLFRELTPAEQEQLDREERSEQEEAYAPKPKRGGGAGRYGSGYRTGGDS